MLSAGVEFFTQMDAIMKKAIYVPLAVMALILVSSMSLYAWRGGHGGHFGGSIWIGP